MARHLIRTARQFYVAEPFDVDLRETVCALDSTTIDLCLVLLHWAPFRSKTAIRLHTLIDLRRNIPSLIHISDGKLRLDPAAAILSKQLEPAQAA